MNDPQKDRARRIDALAVAFGIAFPSLATWVYFVGLAQSGSAAQQAAAVAGKTLQFGFPLVWVFLIRRQRVSPCVGPLRGILEGLVTGGLMLALILAGYHLWFAPAGYLSAGAEEIARKLTGLGVHCVSAYVALATFYSLIHSLLEEYYWRWFVYGQLRRLTGPVSAIAVSSLGFMAHHVIVLSLYFGLFSLETWLFSLSVALAGAIWAWTYQRSGSLLGPWLSHALADAAIFLVGYDLARSLF